MTQFRSKKDGSHFPIGGRGVSSSTFGSVASQDASRQQYSKSKLPSALKDSFKRKPYNIHAISHWLKDHGSEISVGYSGYDVYTIYRPDSEHPEFVKGAKLPELVIGWEKYFADERAHLQTKQHESAEIGKMIQEYNKAHKEIMENPNVSMRVRHRAAWYGKKLTDAGFGHMFLD